MSKKLNASSAANVGADYGSDSAMKVVSREGERQVSSTHGDEAKDQVRALDDGEPVHDPNGAPTDGAAAALNNGNDELQQRSPGSDGQSGEPQPAQPYLPDVEVPSNLVMQDFAAGNMPDGDNQNN